ncbi:hypothetical protein ACFQZE_14045 [Paenibacillus sp. GCM10027627]|uniref:hypothetical protein n=1 Tax=unclassified Paenibacillus TaxID=185978 RepID=UPI0036401D63
MPKWTALLMMALFVLGLLLSTEADALKCMEPPPIQKAYDDYDGVALASVDKIKTRRDHRIVQLTILENFKGLEKKTIKVKENVSWGLSVEGKRYVYFLEKNEDGSWENPLCSLMKEEAAAGEQLEFLRELHQSAKSPPISLKQASEAVTDEGRGGLVIENGTYGAETNLLPPEKKASSFPWGYIAVPIGVVGFAVFGIIHFRSYKRRD